MVKSNTGPNRPVSLADGHQTDDWEIDQFPHGNHCFNSYENAFPGKNKKAAFFYRGGLSDIWNKFVIT